MSQEIADLINKAEILTEVKINPSLVKNPSKNEFLMATTPIFRFKGDLYRKEGILSPHWLKIAILDIIKEESTPSQQQEPKINKKELFTEFKEYVDTKLEEFAKEFKDYVDGEFQRRETNGNN